MIEIDINMKLQQVIFDKVVSHLRLQGRQSKNTLGDCVYRNSNGSSCAVGCLIKDEFYSSNFEGCSVDEIGDVISNSLNVSYREVVKCENLLNDLQSTHDYGLTQWEDDKDKFVLGDNIPAKWEKCFQRIASRYGLTYTSQPAESS